MTGLASSHASATCARGMPRRRDLGHPVNDLAVGILGFREETPESLIRFGPDTGVIPIPCQLPAGLRAPGNDSDPFGGAKRQHLALLLAIQEVDQVLHADEAGPAVPLGDAEGACELPRMRR